MIRTIFTAMMAVISTLIFGLTALIIGLFNPYSKKVDYMAYIWAKTILYASGTKIELYGLENIDREKTYIIMANHQSQFDILALYRIIPLTARFMTKKELFKVPIFGWIIKAAGMIKIDRSNREKAIQSISTALDTMKKEQVSIIVFPEGTRSLTNIVNEFKKGGFIIAIKGGIPIIPISISGSLNISKKHSLKISAGSIKMIIDKPIETKDYKYDQREKLIQDVRAIIIKNYDKEYK
jgi:1-acyl-sn-glycerol-3-phosphate acyltransferase